YKSDNFWLAASRFFEVYELLSAGSTMFLLLFSLYRVVNVAFTKSNNKNLSSKYLYRYNSILRLICFTACSSYFVNPPAIHNNRGDDHSILSETFLPN